MEGDGAKSSAWRRRQRRLRSWLHHSVDRAERDAALRRQRTSAREGEACEPYDTLRGQKRPPPGTRPAPFAEVGEPQVRAATVGYVAATVPLLAQPVLGGGDSLDVTAVQFLLAQSLLQRQREEEEAKEKEERKAKLEDKMLAINRRVRDGPATPAEEAAWRRWSGLERGGPSSSSSGKRRKRKKRRRRTTRRSRRSRCPTLYPS